MWPAPSITRSQPEPISSLSRLECQRVLSSRSFAPATSTVGTPSCECSSRIAAAAGIICAASDALACN